VRIVRDNNIYYYHNDHLGTPIAMTDGSALSVWEGEYLLFGEEISITGSITNNLRFPGQYFDSETNLHYNYYRDYNPVVGRYVESDPVGIEQGENHLFVYVGNNPVNFVDPMGLQHIPTIPPPERPPMPTPKPGEFCKKFFERCMRFCNKCPPAHPLLRVARRTCIAGCFTAWLICEGIRM
jgi:RHS repeat-associated protein